MRATRSSRRSTSVALALAVVFALTAVACGDDAGDSETTRPERGGGSETTEGSVEAPSGEPIVFGTVSLDSGDSIVPDGGDGVEMWAAHVNANGGIEGRPVEVVRCDEAGDASEHERCIRSFIENDDMVGVIPGIARHLGGTGIPLLADAEMPVLIPAPGTVPEFSAPTGIALTGGGMTALHTFTDYFGHEEDADHIVLGHADAAPYGPIIEALRGFAADVDAEVTTIPYPPATTDFAPVATAMTGAGGDLIIAMTGTNVWGSAVQALENVGNAAPVASVPSSINSEAIEAGGAAAEGVYTAQSFPPEDQVETEAGRELYAAYHEQREASGREANDTSLAGFVAGYAAEAAIEEIGVENLTRESLLDFVLNGEFRDVPLLPPVVSRAQAPDDPTFSSLGNPTMFLAQIQDGEIVVVSDRIAPFAEG